MAFSHHCLKHKGRLRLFLLLGVFAAVFCFCLVSLLQRELTLRKEAADFKALAGKMHRASSAPGTFSQNGESLPVASPNESNTSEPTSFAQLSAQNSDYYGWLSIEGTSIDYPVMYTPNDPEHYLRRDFRGHSSLSGTPFADGTVPPGGTNTVIYGHNMQNGTMFAPLLSYRSQSFYEEHPTITLQTQQGLFRYRIIAAFATEILPPGSDAFCYYEYTDLQTEMQFADYVAGCRALTGYPISETAVFGDQLLTLSTCSYHTANGRFVVVAKRCEN